LLFLALQLVVASCYALWSWYTYHPNPLARYGIFYEESWGDDDTISTVFLYWDRGQPRVPDSDDLTRHIWPSCGVTDDDLSVSFIKVGDEKVPEIKIASDIYPDRYSIFRPNFTDPSKPNFELVACHQQVVEYDPPFESYYRSDSESGVTLPFPAK
jgi:hypothetical protein